MILLVHMLFGAAIGYTVGNIPLAILLAFLSHYFLDLFPHIEYNIDAIEEKKIKDKLPVIFKIASDLLFGILLVFVLSNNQLIAYIGAFFGILPDGLTIMQNRFPNNFLSFHKKFHTEKVHFLKNKKFSKFWRILSQITVIIISIILLKF